MKPILYQSNETAFDSNGIGILSDEIDTTVIETLNGQYELEMKYPIKGIHFLEIRSRSIIVVKPDPVADPQPFRVYRITKPMNGQVTVYARHIAYDTMGIPVSPFTANNAPDALQAIKNNAAADCPFEFWTDLEATGDMAVKVPTPMWTLLGNSKGFVLDVYGGEYEFDRYTVRLCSHRGADRGVSIRYGKNLTSLEQDENCANCHTGVYPYWTSSDGKMVQLPEKTIDASGNYGFSNIIPLDLSDEWETAPTEEQLRERATKYITENDIGTPVVSWKVEFVQLEQTEEYKGKALLERVLLGDTVSVEFAEMGVSASARAVERRYKPVLERHESITLGSIRANMADTIARQQKLLNEKPNRSQMQIAIQVLTNAILGAAGGSVRLLDNNGDGQPDTLYIADDPDPTKAVKVWRFNYEGWGASKNGYNGPFIMGASFDSGILGDFITAGTLDAALVKVINIIADNIVAGMLKSKDSNTYFDLDNSKVVCKNEHRSVEISEGTIIIKNKNGITTLFIVDNGIGGMLSFSDGNGNDVGSLFGDLTGLQLSLPNDSGGFTPCVLKWKKVNGVNYLVGE